MTAETETETERGFTIVRHFDAPREQVFRAWTDPEQLDWFVGADRDFHAATVDLRVGGIWRLRLSENGERSYLTGGIYREIVPPERLVFTWGAIDGWPKIDPGRPDDGPIVTIQLQEVETGTEMVFRLGFADQLSEDRVREWLATGMLDGWSQTLDRLVGHRVLLWRPWS